ncbi:MAG: substrate-binding domain-containing protein, partial [Actinomycetota bacterium]|nr:substrate-binding domain-containing protein [Actinomycetota bacterium]
MLAPRTLRKRLMIAGGASLAMIGLLAGCTPGDTGGAGSGGGGEEPTQSTVEGNEESGETVVIGFSGPAADHGWLGAINSAAQAEAEKFDDIDLRVAEGTNDANLQISHIEGFINEGVDAIVLLPTDGAALTEVAIQAME